MTTRNLKLALVTDTLAPWTIGGREAVLSPLLPELASQGVDITVYTMKWWQSQPPDETIGSGTIRVRSICKPRVLYRGSRRSFVQGIIFALGSFRLLRADFDIIETDPVPYFHLPVVWLVSKIRRKPLVVMWHEVWGPVYWREYLGMLGPLGSIVERIYSKIGVILMSASRRTYRQLIELGVHENRLFLSEAAISVSPAPLDSSSPQVLFVGRLIKHKRPDVALRIANDLVDSTIRVGIVGKGPMKDELEKRIVAEGLQNQVLLIDEASEEQLAGLLRNALVLISPSDREGFGLVVAEALSVGTPVVTVNAPANAAKDLVIDNVNGRVCAVGDDEEFSRVTLQLLSTPFDRDAVVNGWETLGIPKSFQEVARNRLRVYATAMGKRS